MDAPAGSVIALGAVPALLLGGRIIVDVVAVGEVAIVLVVVAGAIAVVAVVAGAIAVVVVVAGAVAGPPSAVVDGVETSNGDGGVKDGDAPATDVVDAGNTEPSDACEA